MQFIRCIKTFVDDTKACIYLLSCTNKYVFIDFLDWCLTPFSRVASLCDGSYVHGWGSSLNKHNLYLNKALTRCYRCSWHWSGPFVSAIIGLAKVWCPYIWTNMACVICARRYSARFENSWICISNIEGEHVRERTQLNHMQGTRVGGEWKGVQAV